MAHNGPLQGIKILEIAGVGPRPFCAMRKWGLNELNLLLTSEDAAE